MMKKGQNQGGFTLLELIISIVIVAVMGAMLVAYSGTSLTQSARPAVTAMDGQVAAGCMDCIVQYYRDKFYASGGPLYDVAELADRISDGTFNAHCPGMTLSSQWMAFDGNTISTGSSGTTDLLRVTVAGQTEVRYSLLFSSKR